VGRREVNSLLGETTSHIHITEFGIKNTKFSIVRKEINKSEIMQQPKNHNGLSILHNNLNKLRM
jgi:hypothetical protein